MISSLSYISKNSIIHPKQIEATLKLLNEDATIPFIARYRKEATGNLDELEIEQIQKLNQQILDIQKRKEYIIKTSMILKISASQLILKDKSVVPIRRVYKDTFMEGINKNSFI